MRVGCLLNVRFQELQMNLICLSHEQCKDAAMEARKSSDKQRCFAIVKQNNDICKRLGQHQHSYSFRIVQRAENKEFLLGFTAIGRQLCNEWL